MSQCHQHTLDKLILDERETKDALKILLHTILFTRAPGPVHPMDSFSSSFQLTYAKCGVSDVSTKVDMGITRFIDYISNTSNHTNNYSSSPLYGSQNNYNLYNTNGINDRRSSSPRLRNGMVKISFFERELKKALFGLMSNEQKIIWEEWNVPIQIISTSYSSDERERILEKAKETLQHNLLHIMSVVQSVEHVPAVMYEFEIGYSK